MSHSLTKIWIHAVFGTKDHTPLIKNEFAKQLHAHIKSSLEKDFGCPVKAINGINNYLHLLFLLNPNYSIKDILKNIKGESSHWVNQNNFLNAKFAWHVGYGAFSVSNSGVRIVERYILNQTEHHKKLTFQEEYEKFLLLHGLTVPRETVETVSLKEE